MWTDEKLQTPQQMHGSGEHDVATIARVLGVSQDRSIADFGQVTIRPITRSRVREIQLHP